ncbi:MAG: hypothetical protein ACLRZH_03735 [Ruthenibacterium lactatiformans]
MDEIEQIKARELDKMKPSPGLTAEDAKQLLLNRLDEQLTHERQCIAAFGTQTKDECDTMARGSSARPWRVCRRPFSKPRYPWCRCPVRKRPHHRPEATTSARWRQHEG